MTSLSTKSIVFGVVVGTDLASGHDRFGDALPDGAIARFGTVRWRHTDFCLKAVFVGDGDSLITAGYDGAVEQWDVPSGRRIRTFGRELGAIKSLDVSVDGRFVAAGSQGKKLHVWRISSGEVAWTAKTEGPLTYFAGVAFSPDSRRLAATDSASLIRIFNAESGFEEKVITDERYSIESVAWSPDGRLLASGDMYGDVRVIDFATEKIALKIKHADQANDVCFSPDGLLFASVSGAPNMRRHLGNEEDASIRVCDLQTSTQVSIKQAHGNWIEGVAFSPDGRCVAISEEKKVRIFDVAKDGKLTEKESLLGRNLLFSLRFSRNGKYLVASSEGLAPCLWDLSTGIDIIAGTGQTAMLSSAEYLASGKAILSISLDGTSMLCDFNSLNQVAMPLRSFEGARRVSRSGKYVFTKKGKPTFDVRVIDADSSQTIVEISPGDFSSDFDIDEATDRVAVAGFFGVGMWKLSTGKPIFSAKLEDEPLAVVRFGLQGARIVVWDVEEPVFHVLDSASGKIISQNQTGTCCPVNGDVSPNGQQICIILLDRSRENHRQSEVILYDLGKLHKTVDLFWEGADAFCVKFHSNNLVATGHFDGTVRFWNPHTGKMINRLNCGTQCIRELLFHQNGKEFGTVESDATILIWQMPV